MGISRKSLASIILTIVLISSLVCEPVLADNDISYGALAKNRVHKKAKVGQPANDYTRGCSKIEHCARGEAKQ
ncbi:unnamed protein product [Amaranthus hypochondriacus]